MPDVLPRSELAVRLTSLAASQGLATAAASGDTLTGQHDAILAKWFLGGRKVVYRFSVQLDEATRQARFREVSSESSWGIPPPTLTIEKTSQSGSRVSATRTDKSVGGGGTLQYGRLREAIEQAVRDAGWQFTLEPGKMP
jgi:hypothetical protein